MTTEFFRILVDWLSIQKFRWLSNSSRLRWPQNSFEILQGFWSDIFLKIKWPRNSYEILQGFWSEFWLSAIVSNNSDDYEILQELDDNRILVKFFDNSTMTWSIRIERHLSKYLFLYINSGVKYVSNYINIKMYLLFDAIWYH